MSDLQLKKELNQIKKAARVLRDPGTTTSWKSPLCSSRSATTAAAELVASGASPWKSYDGCETASSKRVNGKKVFLCNWRQKMCDGEVDDVELSSGSLRGDSKSDSCFGSGNRSVSGMPGVARRVKCGSRKKGKRRDTQLGRFQSKEVVKLAHGRKMLLQGLSQDDSVEQSDGTTGDYYYNHNLGDMKRGPDPVVFPMGLELKHKNWAPLSSRLLKNSRKEGSWYSYSSTPALSTSSFNMYGNRNPSIIESWDSDVNDDVDDPLGLPGRQGCGIPCYWSRRMPKHSGGSGSYSSSFSDTLKKKGSSIFCGSHTSNHRRRRSVSSCRKRRIASRSAQGVLPLLNGSDCQERSSLSSGCSDDELSTNLEELDLEAISRLDGRRWSSSCRSRDGLEILALNDGKEQESSPENIRSLTNKYKPLSFADIIGQNIVVHSLINIILRGRIAPFYLFQGPRGTGKTSTARIFASALNCSGPEESKPCGYCRECTDYISGKSRDISEADATDKKQIYKVRHYLKNLMVGSPSVFSHNKVFIVDECHLLHSKTWLEFLKYLEEPLPRVVFIFITTDIDNVPHKVHSRCQKYLFNKIKESDIIFRLKKITAEENLDVEPDALDLIAMNADGSLRDAETMLDQLSLLAKRITTSLVNELVGVVSDEKLLELLGLAMSSNSAKTVKIARELMDAGANPIVLVSQLASLIMDITAGYFRTADAKYSRSFFDGRNLTEAELDRLKHALKLLSEAEKQLRFSSDRSTWFTATLLQLGCSPSADLTQSSSSRRQSSKTTEDLSSASRDSSPYKHNLNSHCMPQKSISPASMSITTSQDDNLKRLDDIWRLCIERCHSKTLRQLLHLHAKLVSVSEVEGLVVAYIAFGNGNIKSRAERFLSSITNSMEIVLRCNVDARIIHLPEDEASMNTLVPLGIPDSLKKKDISIATERDRNRICRNTTSCSKLGSGRSVSKASFNDLDDKLKGGLQDYTNRSASSIDEGSQSSEFVERVANISGLKERGQGIPMQRKKSIIPEQRLETAWLQAEEKGTPASLSWLKPEKNQVLPQDGVCYQHQLEPLNSAEFSAPRLEDELNHELSILKKNDSKAIQKEQIGRYPMSPSLLHDSNFLGPDNKDNLGYESGSGPRGCNGLFCWNRTKHQKRGKVRGTPVKSCRGARFSLLGECGKAKKSKNKVRR